MLRESRPPGSLLPRGEFMPPPINKFALQSALHVCLPNVKSLMHKLSVGPQSYGSDAH